MHPKGGALDDLKQNHEQHAGNTCEQLHKDRGTVCGISIRVIEATDLATIAQLEKAIEETPLTASRTLVPESGFIWRQGRPHLSYVIYKSVRLKALRLHGHSIQPHRYGSDERRTASPRNHHSVPVCA